MPSTGSYKEFYEIDAKYTKGAKLDRFFSDDYAKKLFEALCNGDAKGLIVPGNEEIGFSDLSEYLKREEARIRSEKSLYKR